jgi:Caspase domain
VYRALLICNSTFPNDPAELPELRGPSRDGLLLWNALVDPVCGKFRPETTLALFEKTATEILDHAGTFFGQAASGDTLLFYYSGHGQRFSSHLVLCGRETSAKNLLGTGVPATVLKEMMTTSAAKAIVIILDCCHAGAFKGEVSADDLAGIGRYVIAASGAQKEAGDAERFGLPSPFTATLIDALRSSGGGGVNLDELYDFILANLPARFPRPYKNFYGSGIVEIANGPVDAGAEVTPTLDHSPQVTGSLRSGMRVERWGERGHPSSRASRLTARSRFDLSYGDLRIWQFYLLLGITSVALSWSALVPLEYWEATNYVNSSVSATSACVTASIIGALLVIAASVEGVLVSRISRTEQSRRVILERLQSKGPRRLRLIRDIIAGSAGICAVIGMFLGYPGAEFAVLITILASTFILTVVARLSYGDAAFLCGAIIVGCALFLPQSVSGYNMLSAVSGVGIIQLLTVTVMLLAWYFNERPAILVALALFCAVPISLALATTSYSDSVIGPYVSICGASLALLAGLLGNGITIGDNADAATATFLGTAWNRLLIRLH